MLTTFTVYRRHTHAGIYIASIAVYGVNVAFRLFIGLRCLFCHSKKLQYKRDEEGNVTWSKHAR